MCRHMDRILSMTHDYVDDYKEVGKHYSVKGEIKDKGGGS